LRKKGYRIEAVPSQGYRLLAEPDSLDACSLRLELGNELLMGCRMEYHAETGSTNADAFLAAEEGAVEGTVVLADRQLAGKGGLGGVGSHQPE
jgi:BirA family transcriptional regulator, biotin operon repressor / biotin---[acetyl-CoA-carboxylase] ligase